MDFQFIVIVIIFIAIFVIKEFGWPVIRKKEIFKQNSRPTNMKLPKLEIKNDKLVIVSNASKEEMNKTLIGFCNLYNQKRFEVLPRLHLLEKNVFVISFPYDIDFKYFCYLINYLHYPPELEKTLDVQGWTTTVIGEEWITMETAYKKIMLYIPKDVTEYDNVYMVTAESEEYKLDFARSKVKRIQDSSNLRYKAPEFKIADLFRKEFVDYK